MRPPSPDVSVWVSTPLFSFPGQPTTLATLEARVAAGDRTLSAEGAIDPEAVRLFDHVEREFVVTGETREFGFVYLRHRWN
jgi:hypothetical protein